MASEKIIVLVSDRDDNKHGEVSVLDDPAKAERLVETLIEAGFDQDRIRVFSGRQSEFQISQRPVVALVAEGEVAQAAAGVSAGREAPAAQSRAAEAVAEGDAGAGEAGEAEEQTEEEAAPVRFSSLFRSA